MELRSDGVQWALQRTANDSNTPILQYSNTPILLTLPTPAFHAFICSSAKALRSSAFTSETAQNTNPSCSQCDTL